jgi:hypothetical protein
MLFHHQRYERLSILHTVEARHGQVPAEHVWIPRADETYGAHYIRPVRGLKLRVCEYQHQLRWRATRVS